MKITAGESTLEFIQESGTVVLKGSMRLANLMEYEVVKIFIKESYDKVQDMLTLDFRDLKFLNSSGITTISMFVLSVKRLNKAKLQIIGNSEISWQSKSLNNFKKLWNEVEIIIENL